MSYREFALELGEKGIPLHRDWDWNDDQKIDLENFKHIITHIYFVFWNKQQNRNVEDHIYYIIKMYQNAWQARYEFFLRDNGMDNENDWKNFFIIYNEMNKTNTPYLTIPERNSHYLFGHAPQDKDSEIFNYDYVNHLLEWNHGGGRRKSKRKRRRVKRKTKKQRRKLKRRKSKRKKTKRKKSKRKGKKSRKR